MELTLTKSYAGLAALPRVELCALPTPLERFGDGDLLLVKRDDLTSPAYGGNKVRKLEFLLGQALAEARRTVITFGAYGSNHALAAAVHGTALGLDVHVVLSPQAPGPFAARTLRAHAGIGTHLHPVEGWDGTEEAARVADEIAVRDGIEPLVIPGGGSNEVGAIGYVNAAFELLEQAGETPPDAVYVAAGTVGTLVGLGVGFAAADAPTRVIGVRVTPEEMANESVVGELAERTFKLLASVEPRFPRRSFADLPIELRHDWFEPGYGVPTPETRAAVARAAEAGIALETTYTGKAFAALQADAAAGVLDGKRVVFWNTYSSAPMPPAGPDENLPQVLRDYVTECDRLYEDVSGDESIDALGDERTEGDRE